MPGTLEALSQVPMFSQLPRRALERLERITRQRGFQPGETIVKEGDEGVGFFMITSGKVDVTRGGKALNTLGAGEFFGEMALLDNHRRSATVVAVEQTECLVMLRSDFIAELQSNADLAIDMLGILSRRVRDLDERLAEYA
ncbi:MAG: cyclic nucleotide-binding domain-containing protein [Bryocella sp.]